MNRLSCDTEQTKELVGRRASTQSKGERLTKKRSFAALLGAHYVTALILSYKRSHSDRHRRLVIMKTGGARTIETTFNGQNSVLKNLLASFMHQPLMVTAFDL